MLPTREILQAGKAHRRLRSGDIYWGVRVYLHFCRDCDAARRQPDPHPVWERRTRL